MTPRSPQRLVLDAPRVPGARGRGFARVRTRSGGEKAAHLTPMRRGAPRGALTFYPFLVPLHYSRASRSWSEANGASAASTSPALGRLLGSLAQHRARSAARVGQRGARATCSGRAATPFFYRRNVTHCGRTVWQRTSTRHGRTRRRRARRRRPGRGRSRARALCPRRARGGRTRPRARVRWRRARRPRGRAALRGGGGARGVRGARATRPELRPRVPCAATRANGATATRAALATRQT